MVNFRLIQAAVPRSSKLLLLTKAEQIELLSEQKYPESLISIKEVRGESCYTDRVWMQHGEEVRAAQELGAGRLEQQGEARATTAVSNCTFSPELCNEVNTNRLSFEMMNGYQGRQWHKLI